MESAVCPVSGNADFEHTLSLPDRFAPRSSRWSLVRERSSGMLLLSPRPELHEMGYYYNQGSYDPHLHATQASSLRDRLYLAARNVTIQRKASLVLRGDRNAPSTSGILEIGCSTGDLLRCLSRHKGVPSQQLAGVETNEAAARTAEKRTGIRICRTGPGGLPKESRYRRIIFWHALEHLHDLHATLSECVARLDKNGIMVIALPNPESRDARHYRDNWVAWDAPRHLWHFTRATLGALLARHGLEIFDLRPYLPDTFYTCLYSEKLAKAEKGRPFTPVDMGSAFLQTAIGIGCTFINRESASTLIYYCRPVA